MPSTERYTHGYSEPVLASHGARTIENSFAYGRHLLRGGLRVLDLGCGPGSITAEIAAQVAPGPVVAVDIDAGVLRRARDQAGALTNLGFVQGAAPHLGFPDDWFDLSHAHQVLQHLADPVAALRELARVTRPGGTIAVRDADYAALSWYPELPELEQWRQLYRRAARANSGEPDAGRHLLAWAHSAGLSSVEVSSSTWTFTAGSGAQWWGNSWAQRVLADDFSRAVVDRGFASAADLERIAQAWREWADHPDAWFNVVHCELLATC